MEFQDILSLLDQFDSSNMTKLELESDGMKLKLEKGAAAQAAPSISVAAVQPPVPFLEEGELIKAPLVVTFYAAAETGATPFCAVGNTVKKGQTLCILEAMKMMSEIPAPMDCVILEVLAGNGSLVEYDQPLFRVKTI